MTRILMQLQLSNYAPVENVGNHFILSADSGYQMMAGRIYEMLKFCELILEAVIILAFEISSIVERLWAKFISKNVLNFLICKIRMNIYLPKLLQKKCAKKTNNNLLKWQKHQIQNHR